MSEWFIISYKRFIASEEINYNLYTIPYKMQDFQTLWRQDAYLNRLKESKEIRKILKEMLFLS